MAASTVYSLIEPVNPKHKDLLLPLWHVRVEIETLKSQIKTASAILLNTLSTVGIVWMNKIIFSDSQFRNCQISIAIWHFLVTFMVLALVSRPSINLFAPTRVPIRQMIPICALFAGFLVLNNLSLALNSIGFYQIAKIMTTPAVVGINYVLFRKMLPRAQLLAVITTCVGVGMTTRGDLASRPFPALIAVAAFSVTACYQIWIGKKLQELKLTPPQLLLNQAPVAIGLLLFLVPFFDIRPNLSLVSTKVIFTAFASGFIASMINLSQFLIIGRTSVLTYNIISMVKTMSILSLGWYVDKRLPSPQELSGVIVALAGSWYYIAAKR